MNCCLNQPSARRLSAVAGSRRQHGLMRILHSTVAVMTGLVVLAMVGSLNAADSPAAKKASAKPAVSSPSNVPVPVSTNGPNILDDKYRLVIGDQLSFQIIEDEDDPVHLVVTDSGDLQVPYVGRYPAVGKTCKELSDGLKGELTKEYYKQATVIVAVDLKPRSRGKIYLVGAVGAQGPQDISSEEVLTVSKAILRAGGLTGYADGKNVKVTRSDETAFIVNVSRLLDGKGK